MSTEHLWVAPGEVVTDVSGRVQLPKPGEDGFRLSTQAEEGSVGSSEMLFDDEAGDFYPVGLNAYRVRETLSDAADPYIYIGAFGARREVRGPYRTGGSRQVQAQLQDANAILSRYVIRSDEDGNRPQETETERWAWLVTTSAFTLHFDEATSIIEAGDVVLSAADLADYTLEQIVSDMAQSTGKNYYVFVDGSVEPPEAWFVYAPDSGAHLTSDLRLSNVESDVDGVTTFALGLDAELEINPERLASYVSVRYANGRVDENDAGTAAEFSRVDRVMDAALVKTASVATERALQYLDDLDDEEVVVSGSVYLPAAVASQFRAGMRVQVKATHLTGLADFTYVRLLEVTITNISEDPYLTYACEFQGTFTPGQAALSCAGSIISITADISESLSSNIFDPPIVGEYGPYTLDGDLAVSFIAVGANGWTLADGDEEVPIDSPDWNELGCLPGSIGGTHTMMNVAHRDIGSSQDITWQGPLGVFDPFGVGNGYVINFVIPGATFVQKATSIGGGGVPTWASPLTPGNMVISCGVAEGPTAWGTLPGPVDEVVEIATQVPALDNPNSNMRVYAVCVTEDNAGDITAGNAGSSWWAHMFEVSFS